MARTTFKITEWNAEQLLGRSTQILEAFAPVIAKAARDQLTTVKWVWPNSTLRFRSLYQGGKTVQFGSGRSGVLIPAGRRDIVDTGTLLDSQQAPQVAGNALTIQWTAPYAMNVLRGSYPDPYVNPAGDTATPGDRPARDWIAGALRAQPFRPFFVQKWRELASGTGPNQRR